MTWEIIEESNIFIDKQSAIDFYTIQGAIIIIIIIILFFIKLTKYD
jgi:hypothetical protein